MTSVDLNSDIRVATFKGRALRIVKSLGVSRRFSSEVGLIFFANLLNNLTALAANILVARVYGQETFGLFSLMVTVAMSSLVLSECGMNVTMVRFYKLHQDDTEKSRAVLLSNFYFKLLALSVLVACGLALGDYLAETFAGGREHSLLMGASLAAGGVLGFWSFFRAFFQSVGRFKTIAGLTLAYTLLRVACLGGFLAGTAKPGPLLLLLGIYVLPLLLIFCVCLALFRSRIGSGSLSTGIFDMFKETVKYSRWVAISSIAFVLIQKSLVFIAAAYGDLSKVAILNAALVFTAVFSLINDSIQQVLFPRVADLKLEDIGNFRKKIMKLCPYYAGISAGLILVISLIMSMVLGGDYAKSIPLFCITAAGTAATAFIGFYSMLLHALHRPDLGMKVNLATLVIFLLLGIPLMKYSSLLVLASCYAVILIAGELAKVALVEKQARVLSC